MALISKRHIVPLQTLTKSIEARRFLSWLFLRRRVGLLVDGSTEPGDRMVARSDDELPVNDLHFLVIRRVQTAGVQSCPGGRLSGPARPCPDLPGLVQPCPVLLGLVRICSVLLTPV